MKVGFVVASISRKAGGLFESVRRLAQTLHDVESCYVDVFGTQDEHTAADVAAWQPLHPQTFPVRGPVQFGYAPELSRRLSQDPAIELLNVHGIWMYPSVVSLEWLRRQRKPSIVHPHGMLDPWAVSHHVWKKRLAGWAYENAHLRRASCVRALCPAEAAAVRHYGLRNPVCVVPNGIDLPEELPWCPPPWDGQIEPGRRVLLFLGRLHPKKGLSPFLHGWAEAKRQDPRAVAGWATVVAGWDQDGHADEMAALADELGIAHDVVFVGPQYDEGKAACLARANAFILPSYSEGLPMAVLEAWAYGLPVVMTPACNLPEGFTAGAAVRVEPEAGAIARGLLELFHLSGEQRRTLGRNGRRLVVERFTWPIIAAQMRAVYEWILGGGCPPSCVWTN